MYYQPNTDVCNFSQIQALFIVKWVS